MIGHFILFRVLATVIVVISLPVIATLSHLDHKWQATKTEEAVFFWVSLAYLVLIISAVVALIWGV